MATRSAASTSPSRPATADSLLQHVGRAKKHVHDVGVDHEIVAPDAIKHRLELVRELGDDRVTHRRAHALDGVHGAKNRADVRRGRGGARVALELEQRMVHRRDVFTALGEKQLGVLKIVHGDAGRSPYPSTRWTASSTRLGWNGLTTKSLAPA